MLKRSLIVLTVVAGLAGAVVWACGPDFPNQLLDHREGALKSTPQNSFAFEAKHLLVATDALQPQETNIYSTDKDDKQRQAKMLGLTPEQAERVATLRDADTGSAAYEDGKDLPADLRWYTAGAVDYSNGAMACEGSDESEMSDAERQACAQPDAEAWAHAAASFEHVLALPPEQAKLRSVWAAYMLGSIHAKQAEAQAGDAAVFNRERDAAVKFFELARARAVAGASDTQGLAVASFGEQARLYLYNGARQCSWADLYNGNDCGDGIAAADIKHAIALYAAQAGHGSDSAVLSLAAIAGDVLKSSERTAAIVDGPVSQRLLVTYALARMDTTDADIAADITADTGAAAKQTAKANPALLALVDAIERQGLDRVSGADRLAALSYQIGRYDLAAKLVDKAPGPLASWVRAKLALRKGDLAAAGAAYAEAAKAFPKADDPKASLEVDSMHLLIAESGVLALARGEYVEAMGHLYDAANAVGGSGNTYDESSGSGIGYGNDAAYVAERVLTVDELKSFIDARAPASPAPSPASAKSTQEAWAYGQTPLADELRWLLARRLMRAARYDEAQNYFPARGDRRFATSDQPVVDLRAKAREYAKAVHDSDHAWTDIGRAEARYAAAVIAREQGMELLGYQQGPDYQDNGGGYPGGSGHTANDLKGSYVTEGERQRFAGSGAMPELRFHYRYLAVNRASSAADLLPPRSQAFAAVLCKATGWMLDGPGGGFYDGPGATADGSPATEPVDERSKRVKELYTRYVKQGAYVPWADDFGRSCEEPNFDAARKLKRAQQMVAIKHYVRRNKLYALGGFVVVLGAIAAWFIRRRRQRAVQ
ncbi:hypothetical protein [Dyella tabacisoli]|uniref:Uncharacterized protein n=1 Tax=Dyella tabacisoli TaxID=2282381 RepID=A0A369UQ14_9GAMM|nr:hypothetical protein [Dyella tabacisoli]RDD82557.1 hypothetical protein DVJ77_06415 [Dyella tabacisoli]